MVLVSMLLSKPSTSFRFPNLPRPEYGHPKDRGCESVETVLRHYPLGGLNQGPKVSACGVDGARKLKNAPICENNNSAKNMERFTILRVIHAQGPC